VHFPGTANVTEAAITAVTATVPAGPGRLNRLCAALSALAEGKIPEGSCAAEVNADETAALHVFSNPLYSVATPKHVC
jgi:hypothetical protein